MKRPPVYSSPTVEVGGQVEVLLLQKIDSVTCSIPVVYFSQDVATVEGGLPYPAVVTGAAVGWDLSC